MKMLLKTEFLFNYKTGFLHLLLLLSYKVLYFMVRQVLDQTELQAPSSIIERSRDKIPIKLVGEIDPWIAFLLRLLFKLETSMSNYMVLLFGNFTK